MILQSIVMSPWRNAKKRLEILWKEKSGSFSSNWYGDACAKLEDIKMISREEGEAKN